MSLKRGSILFLEIRDRRDLRMKRIKLMNAKGRAFMPTS
jgi:hypothetical protein